MKVTYKDNPYDCPDGRYLARFRGVVPFSSETARDKNGNPIPPGLKFEWEIAEGPNQGCMVNKITAKIPTKKNSCGRILQALFAGMLDDGVECDTDRMVGHYYRVMIVDGIVADNPAPMYIGAKRPNDAKTPDGAEGTSSTGGATENQPSSSNIPF